MKKQMTSMTPAMVLLAGLLTGPVQAQDGHQQGGVTTKKYRYWQVIY